MNCKQKSSLDDVDRVWFECFDRDSISTSLPSSHGQQQYTQYTRTLLSNELLSTINDLLSIVNDPTSTEILQEIDTTTRTTQENASHLLGRIAWVWKKFCEIQLSISRENSGDIGTNDSSFSVVEYTRQNALTNIGTAILHRYGSLYSKKHKQCPCVKPFLKVDIILSSWTEAAVLLAIERGNDRPSTSTYLFDEISFRDHAFPSASISIDNNGDNSLYQAWITIARHNYFELAELWWDRLNLSPIGVINRQGMTALQFAARSGHLLMVQWFIRHRISNSIAYSEDGANSNYLLDWVQHCDQRGQTALSSAKANDHEQIVQFLESYINSHSVKS